VADPARDADAGCETGVTRDRAQVLRRNTTLPEREAWALLRQLSGEGIHVRRQHPIGRYVVDFAVMRTRVAIEIDGPLHERPERALADIDRDAALEKVGWRVIRFTSKQLENADAFLTAVRAARHSPSPRVVGAGGEVNHGARSERHGSASAPSANDGGSPHPLTPSPRGEGEIGKRRVRGKRVLPSRAKPQ
jgi:very-short-patch-repair endonuclease